MSFERPKPADAVIPPWMARLLDQVREAEQEEGTFEIEAEDELPSAQLGSWVALSGVTPRAMALYWFMAMHLNLKRGDRYVWPSKDALAYLMQYSRGDKIDPFLKELIAIGAVVVVSVPDSSGPQKRNVYRLPATPPPGWSGPVSTHDWYADHEVEHPENLGSPSASRIAAPRRPRLSSRTRWAVFARDGYRCLACGALENLTIDHIEHQSRGGGHEVENLRTLCLSCNSRRGAGALDEVDR
jgi:hypothetical protein